MVCDQTNSTIWRAYPWRWAQASLTSASGVLALADGTQDYSIGTTTGGGFYQLMRVRITRSDVTPNIVREKELTHWLAPNIETKGSIDTIRMMCFEPISQGIRLDRAASVPSGTTYRIDGEYWFQPVKVTSTAATIVFPDAYFQTVIECVKWKYYQLGDDKRAFAQKAVFEEELGKMIAQEDYGDAPGTRFPGDPIGVTRAGNPGLFGWS